MTVPSSQPDQLGTSCAHGRKRPLSSRALPALSCPPHATWGEVAGAWGGHGAFQTSLPSGNCSWTLASSPISFQTTQNLLFQRGHPGRRRTDRRAHPGPLGVACRGGLCVPTRPGALMGQAPETLPRPPPDVCSPAGPPAQAPSSQTPGRAPAGRSRGLPSPASLWGGRGLLCLMRHFMLSCLGDSDQTEAFAPSWESLGRDHLSSSALPAGRLLRAAAASPGGGGGSRGSLRTRPLPMLFCPSPCSALEARVNGGGG